MNLYPTRLTYLGYLFEIDMRLDEHDHYVMVIRAISPQTPVAALVALDEMLRATIERLKAAAGIPDERSE